jgi:transcriptional regulator with XRE-family HTH domain
MWGLLAYYLRFCRQQRKLSGEELGRLMGVSKPTVSRLETGLKALEESEARAIDAAWNTGDLFTLMVFWASAAHDPQWFTQYKDKEQKAEMLRIFEANLMPGLLQTELYIRALIATGDALDPEALLADRMNRQQVLDRRPHPFVHVILSQNAIEWPVGSPAIMRAQLAWLLELAERPQVVLQVVPRTWDTGAYPGLDGSFQLLTGAWGEVAYSESPWRGRLVTAQSDVGHYSKRWNRVSAKALPDEASKALLKRVMEGFSDEDSVAEE